jgi:hypothetical protein
LNWTLHHAAGIGPEAVLAWQADRHRSVLVAR